MEHTTQTRMITTRQAAAIAGVSERTVKRWHTAGKLTGHRDAMTGRLYYDREELLAKLNGG